MRTTLRGSIFAQTSVCRRQGGGEAYFGALTLGGNFDGGRGNAVLNVEYNKQTGLKNNDRAASLRSSSVRINNPAIAAGLGVSEEFQNVIVDDYRYTIYAPGTLITLAGNQLSFPGLVDPNLTEIGGVPVSQIVDPLTGEVRPQDFGRYRDGGFFTSGGDGILLYYSNPEAESIPELDRYFINSFADYDFTDSVTGFVEVKYARTESAGRSNQATRLLGLTVLDENPFIPQLVQDQFASLDAQGLDPSILVTRDFLDDVATGPVETERQTFRIVGGFKGEVSKALSYEISANYGRTDTSVINNSELLLDRAIAAADVIADPTTGEPICRSDIDSDTLPPTAVFPSLVTPGFRSFAPGDGSCAPLNIFAQTNAIDPAAADFIFQRVEDTFELEQFVINATIAGNSDDFFSLPAGGVSYAVGVEYREEKSQSIPNSLQLNDLNRFQAFALPGIISGSFDVVEGFAEVSIPVLADLPFAKGLTVDASIRVADYSSVGSTTSFAFGSVWRPVDDFRLRASFNRAVRAPNISELFRPRDQGPGQFNAGQDPCDPISIANGSETRAQNCAEFIPDLATFDPSPAYAVGGLTFITGGNPNLSAETADTYTVGFVYTPQQLSGLAIIADYYNIDIVDAVGSLGRDIVARCVDFETIDNNFCDGVVRNPTTGVLEIVDQSILNLGATRSAGIDYKLSYDFNLDSIFDSNVGNLHVGVAGTYLIKREDQAAAGFAGTINQLDGELNFPRHFINFTLSWDKGPWRADYGFNFQSNTVFAEGFGIEEIEEDPFTLDRPNIGSASVHYLGGAYQLNENFQFSLRVNNLFNREPFDVRTLGPAFTAVRPASLLGRTVQIGVQGTF
ncbi:MAG: TonB-dependent receptor [Pseudomonadota bacterium]